MISVHRSTRSRRRLPDRDAACLRLLALLRRGAGVRGGGVGFAASDCIATGLAVAGGVSFCLWRRKTNPRPAMITKMRKARILCFGAVAKPLLRTGAFLEPITHCVTGFRGQLKAA